ncbi:glycosyltransferase family 39 protein [Lutibacter sp.]|uniref:ArnT family glycosyltransferase n=1 Tax=Lutibacter sp. TaxID=1925666 RepID=UPI0025BF31D0|nr:glycosyltransferase family 39 protein [Lutibacter sp.]MCF6181972.1 glycosyltransferase family 39 protein [Lutibacter sp.]
MSQKKNKNTRLYLLISVITIIVFKFILSAAIPLLDKTESRYAEIARIMAETKEWVVLQIDYGVPFWAKPPLSTWLSALSFDIFGVDELTARLPSFLISLLIIYIVGKSIKKTNISFYLIAFILLTMPEFLIHTGVVSTDTALNFCVVIIMLSFWKAMENKNKSFWNYLFFIGVGLGFLAKGPLILVLTGPPILAWIIIQKIKLKTVFTKLPWFIGTVLVLIIAVPWYIIAEERSPGFLDYFIVGEHFKRFLEPGWKGDLYGSGHSQPKGMIWVFLFIFTFPWFQIVLIKLWKNRKSILNNKWISYLVFWLIWTPLFFTMSTNILHTYILPVTIPIALLAVYYWDSYTNKKVVLGLGSIFPILAIVAFIGISFTNKVDYYANSDKYLLQHQFVNSTNKSVPIYYWKQKNYSGQFYSKGKAKEVKNEKELDSVSTIYPEIYFLISNKHKKDISKEMLSKMNLLESNYKTSIYKIE